MRGDIELGAAIRSVRERQGVTVGELAERAGVPLEMVGRVESGEHDPLWTEVVCLADALGLTVSGLVEAGSSQRPL